MLRPQPIGIFPMPANFLLLPESWQDSADYQNALQEFSRKKIRFLSLRLMANRKKP
jgi:hypothetical protein